MRERRFDLGWTQAPLTAAMAAGPEDVARWEQASRGTSTDTEIAVCLMSDDGPADPFGGSGPKPRPRPTAETPPATPAVPRRSSPGILFPGSSPAVVYSSGPLIGDAPGFAIGRLARTFAVLVALGVVLWWAFGRLGTVL